MSEDSNYITPPTHSFAGLPAFYSFAMLTSLGEIRGIRVICEICGLNASKRLLQPGGRSALLNLSILPDRTTLG